MDQPSYHPPSDIWSDDARMAALMSMFKQRSVNPHDYDAKLKFWQQQVLDSCTQVRNPVVSFRELMARFKRRDRVPAGLKTVLEEMHRTQQIATLNAFRKGASGLVGWCVESLIKKPTSWLFGYASSAPAEDDITSQHFVVLEEVKAQADQLLELYNSSSDSDVFEEHNGIIEQSELRRLSRHICATETALELALIQLERAGHVSLGTAPNGDKIVKFRGSKDNGDVVQVTAVDTNTLNVKKAMEKLDRDILKLERTIKSLETDARAQLKQGNKVKAKQLLRQKQLATKHLNDKDQQYTKLSALLHNLSQSNHQRSVMDAYKAGVSAFKENMSRHGLSPEKIDETMEDINEAMSDQDEISAAIAQGPSGSGRDSVADEELERELDELLKEDQLKNKKRKGADVDFGLPDVPSSSGAFAMDVDDEEETVPRRKIQRKEEKGEPVKLDRLQELRRQLEAA